MNRRKALKIGIVTAATPALAKTGGTTLDSKHHAMTKIVTPDISVEQAMIRLKKCIHEDDEMAWGWHCNLAMTFFDEGIENEAAQRAARRFMGLLFDRSDYPSPNI